MEEQFVPYELAVRLKELGFDEECFKVYDDSATLQYEEIMNICEKDCDCKLYKLKAPLWQQAFSFISPKIDGNPRYRLMIAKYNGNVVLQKSNLDGFWTNISNRTNKDALEKIIEIIEK